MAEIGDLKVKISAETRELTDTLNRISRLVSGEPTVWDLVRSDPSVILFWIACFLIPFGVAGLVR